MRELSAVLKGSLPPLIVVLFAISCMLLKEYNYEAAQVVYFSILFITEIILILNMYKHSSMFQEERKNI